MEIFAIHIYTAWNLWSKLYHLAAIAEISTLKLFEKKFFASYWKLIGTKGYK